MATEKTSCGCSGCTTLIKYDGIGPFPSKERRSACSDSCRSFLSPFAEQIKERNVSEGKLEEIMGRERRKESKREIESKREERKRESSRQREIEQSTDREREREEYGKETSNSDV